LFKYWWVVVVGAALNVVALIQLARGAGQAVWMWAFFGIVGFFAASVLAFMDMRRQRDTVRAELATAGTSEKTALVSLAREGARLRQTIPSAEVPADLSEHAERVQLWSRQARRLIDRLGGATSTIADQELGGLGYDGRRQAAPDVIAAYIDARLRSLNEVRDRA
jgi:hypothetical protein